MKGGQTCTQTRSPRHGSRWSVLLALILALAAAPAVAQRQLSWRLLAVEARLDGEGMLWVRESHTMVFSGDWNGGERIFRLAPSQPFELLGVARVDPASGEEVPLTEGDLGLVDNFDWIDRKTLRWRSRRPSDPPFDETAITYVLEYRTGRVLRSLGGLYRLDHDFAFPDRQWPIESFTLELELDPVWLPEAQLATRHGPVDLGSFGTYVVTADLRFTGSGAPAGVRHLPPVALRAAVFVLAGLAMLWLWIDFRRREAELGRYAPPPVPSGIDPEWLEEHLFDLLPEEAGALWDRKVGQQEVAAILARWEAEGKIASEVVAGKGRRKRDVLELELLVDHDSFRGYEHRLASKLFFGGRRETDTEAIRKHYKKSGFDPAGIVRAGIERRLERRRGELVRPAKMPAGDKRRTLALFFGFLALMGVEALAGPLMTLQLAGLLIAPLVVLYLLLGLIFAFVFRRRLTRLDLWSLGFLLPGLIFYADSAVAAFADRLLPRAGFTPQPGLAGTAALAVLAVMVWSSLLNNARSRERAGTVRRRQNLDAARRLLTRQLEREQPELIDEWMPYLLALGLGPRVDSWWRRFGGLASGEAASASVGRFASSTGGGGSWTGGGGTFGGAGATASWVAAASSVAAGVTKPSSGSGSSGGGGGGGSSSGGGGGGGW